MKSFVTTSPLILGLVLVLFLFTSSSCRPLPTDPDQAAQVPLAEAPNGPALYIVFTAEPPAAEDKNHFYLRILTRVFDSAEAAQNALVLAYKHVITGFAAKLTPDQVAKLSEQPEVLTVMKDGTVGIDPLR